MPSKKALVVMLSVAIAGVVIASSLVATSALLKPVWAVINVVPSQDPDQTSPKIVLREAIAKYPELYNAMNETNRKYQKLVDICTNSNACAGYGAPPIETTTRFQMPLLTAQAMVSDSVFGFERKMPTNDPQARIQVENTIYVITVLGL